MHLDLGHVAEGRLRLEDEAVPPATNNSIVIVRTFHEASCDLVMRIAPWCRDDLIEYLLAVHPSQCASVMERLKKSISSFPTIESKLLTLSSWNYLNTTSNCASLLAMNIPGWIPRGDRLHLCHGNFEGVNWPEVDLLGADLRASCFAGANLSGAILADSQIETTDFLGANLQGANFASKPKPVNEGDEPRSLMS